MVQFITVRVYKQLRKKIKFPRKVNMYSDVLENCNDRGTVAAEIYR